MSIEEARREAELKLRSLLDLREQVLTCVASAEYLAEEAGRKFRTTQDLKSACDVLRDIVATCERLAGEARSLASKRFADILERRMAVTDFVKRCSRALAELSERVGKL